MEEPISTELFLALAKTQFGFIHELLVKVHALILLAQKQGVPDAQLAECLLRSELMDRHQKMLEVLADSADSASIEAFLENFEGPLQ